MEWKEEEIQYLKDNYNTNPFCVIKEKLNRPEGSIYNKVWRLGLSGQNSVMLSSRKYSVNEQFFDQVGNAQCYWAGFIAADGNIQKGSNRVGIKLARKDKNHLESLKNLVNYTGPIIDDIKLSFAKPCEFSCLRFSSVPTWIERLREVYNIVPNKTLILQPPNLEKKEHIFSYLAGYIDGDGHISKTKYGIMIGVLGTFNLLQWCKEKCDYYFSINLKSSVRKNGTQYSFNINGHKALALQDYVFTLGIPLLSRKWCK